MNQLKQLGVQPLEWTGQTLRLLDQRLLPEQQVYHEYDNAGDIRDAIFQMQVRGAPAIGIAAAYGVALSVRQHFGVDKRDWKTRVKQDIQLLSTSRPTAVNLFWALHKMEQLFEQHHDNPVAAAARLAQQIHADDIEANLRMGEAGADLLGEAQAVMTHCNAGALATGGYGTALGVIRSASKRGLKNIYAGETRPWLQGARLTAWELQQDGIDVTLIADSAAAWLMKSGKLDWIIVGADRIAANGDVANKIGTYSLAVLARQHDVKLMVVAPTSTIDFSMESGENITIEMRSADELLPACYQNTNVSAWNPVFDVTPAKLVSAIVTERGVVMNPAEQNGVRSLQ